MTHELVCCQKFIYKSSYSVILTTDLLPQNRDVILSRISSKFDRSCNMWWISLWYLLVDRWTGMCWVGVGVTCINKSSNIQTILVIPLWRSAAVLLYFFILFQYICEEHFQKLSGGRSVFTGLKANTHFGRPQLNSMFSAVHRAHPMVRINCELIM